MSKAVFGSANGSSLMLYKGYPSLSRSGKNWTVTYRYWCQLALSTSLVPASYSACPFTGHSSLLLQETNITANGIAGMCDVELIYRAASGTYSSAKKDGDIEQSSVVGWMEIPLDDPRLVSSGLLSSAQVKAKIESGYQTYSVGTIEYTYSEYLDSFTWSESNLTANIGETQAPAGMTSGTTGNWMLVGFTVKQQGDIIEKSRTWRYNKLGWKA